MPAATSSPTSFVHLNLLDAGERLLARHGLEGVSLRQISAAAGTRNNYAVQAHFGDLDGLVRAIIEHRAPSIELRRAELLGQLVGLMPPTVLQLLEVMYLPIVEGSRPGEPSVYARLNLILLTSSRGWEPLDDVYADKPVTRRTLELIVEANAHVAPSVTWRRMQFSTVALLAAVIAAYNVQDTEQFYRAAVADAFQMAAGAVTAPAA